MGLALVFLSPWSAVLAAAAVPVLLLLYFLRLRRHMLRIPSTLLWRSTTRDLQANVPFQRLRPSLLLLLQLLALTLIVLAIGRPVLRAGGGSASRVILMIDTSASMNAPAGEEGLTRLDAALDAARRAVRRLGRRGEPAQIMIVAFAASARVASSFESNRGLLLDAIEAIEPTDEEADLQAALDLAGAFAGGDERGRPPEIVLFSDGTVADPGAGGFTLPAGTLRFVGAAEPGGPVDNVGIVTFSARRDYEDRRRVLVFARLLNAGPAAVEAPVTLRVDGEPARIRTVRVPAAAPGGPAGEASFTAELEVGGSAVLALNTARRDHLAADDTAAIVLTPPAAPRIGVVHAGVEPDAFVYGLVEAIEPRRLVLLPAADGAAVPWTVDDVDLAVLDGVVPAALPGVPSLGFASTSPPPPAGRPPPARVLSWDRAHPLLRHVSLDGVVYVRGAGPLESPWKGIAFGPRGPVIAETTDDGTRHVTVAFRLRDSNWPLDVSLTVFLQNVLDELVRGAGGAAIARRTGEPVTVRPRPGAEALRITGPIDAPIELEVDRGGAVTLPRLARVGLYRVQGAVPPNDRIAVNLFSDVESDIRPRPEVMINARPTAAARAADAAPLELWPWLAAAALAILGLEWLVYCLRVRR